MNAVSWILARAAAAVETLLAGLTGMGIGLSDRKREKFALSITKH